MNRTNRSLYDMVLEVLGLRDDDAVLEIGFGNGAHIREILEAHTSLSYAGADISETMVDEATARNADLIGQGRARIVHASSDDLPFGDAIFTRAFAINTVYFWESPEAHLGEIRRALKPGGIICLAIRSREFMTDLPFARHGFRLYSEDALRDLLRRSGFDIRSVLRRDDSSESVAGGDRGKDAIIISAERPLAA